jgi:ferritin-like protein
MSSEDLHIPREKLSKTARLMHYAITSLKEELDAVDWYRQRADDAENDELRAVLLHNMREEMEHACMLIEWLRRNNTDFDTHIRTYLFAEGPLLEVEEKSDKAGGSDRSAGEGAGGERGGSSAPPARRKPGFTVGPLGS